MALGESALAVVEQNEVDERPVPSLCKNDIEVAVAIEIAKTGVGTRIGGCPPESRRDSSGCWRPRE